MAAPLPVRRQLRASAVYGEDPPPVDDPAETYHEASKLARSTVAASGGPMGYTGRLTRLVESDRMRPMRRPGGAVVALPEAADLRIPLEMAIQRRRSERTFAPEPLTLPAVASLLDAAYGIRPATGDDPPGRAVPSGGGRYPLELYCIPRRVNGLPDALYHYDPWRRQLWTLDDRPASDRLARTVAHDDIVRAGAVSFVLAATFWRSRAKYGLRSYRFVLLEAGHSAQNLLLAAAGLDLAAVPLGGFYDRELDGLLRLDGVNQGALYVLVAGRRR